MNNTICDINGGNSSLLCEYFKTNCNTKYYIIAGSFYCRHSGSSLILALYSFAVLFSIICLITLLGVISSNYLLFSVTNFTDLLNVSDECLSYVVIPALNCTPDILNYHFSINSDSVDLIMGQVIGANLITFTVIVGTIGCLVPFTVTNRMELLKEYSYISALILMMTYIVSDSKMTILESAFLTAMYALYLVSSLLSSSSDTTKPDLERATETRTGQVDDTTRLLSENESVTFESNEQKSKLTIIVNYFSEFLYLILIFFIPVSKKTLQKMNNSSESLSSRIMASHVFHIWINFVCVSLLNALSFQTSIWSICVIVAGISSLKFIPGLLEHEVCMFFVDVAGIVNSMVIITKLTKIIIQLLKNLGIMWNVSQYAMGLIVFSLLNSMNDIIMNVSLAVNLNPSHGIKSCLGSCCLLISIGLGFNGFWLLASRGLKNGNIWNQFLPITLNWEIYVSLASLNFVSLFTLCYLSLNDWAMDQKLGCSLIFFWILTIAACIFCF